MRRTRSGIGVGSSVVPQSGATQIAAGSIASAYQSRVTARNKSIQQFLKDAQPHEAKVAALWTQHGHEIEVLTGTRFELGGEISWLIQAVRTAKYPGGFKAYHEDRKIPVPRTSCLRLAALYEDVKSLGLKEAVLQAAYAEGLDLAKYVGKIKLAKTRVQSMTGPEFVAFLQQKSARAQHPKPEAVVDFVDAGMVALAKVFDGIGTDEEKNQAYAGVAYQISVFSQEAAFSGGEFVVKSPLAKDELEQLFHVREV